MNPITMSYIVIAYSIENKIVFSAVFTEESEKAAIKAFRECYRYNTYHILSVVKVPDDCTIDGCLK